MSLRRSLIALSAVVLAVLGVAVGGGPAQAASTTEINILGSSHCLDNATEIASKLQMWSCTGGPEQQWTELFDNQTDTAMLINQNTGWCITAPSQWGSLVMAPCDTSAPTQQWHINLTDTPVGQPTAEFFMLQSAASGLCLATSSVGNGTVPHMVTCDPTEHYERWILF